MKNNGTLKLSNNTFQRVYRFLACCEVHSVNSRWVTTKPLVVFGSHSLLRNHLNLVKSVNRHCRLQFSSLTRVSTANSVKTLETVDSKVFRLKTVRIIFTFGAFAGTFNLKGVSELLIIIILWRIRFSERLKSRLSLQTFKPKLLSVSSKDAIARSEFSY